MRRTAGAAETRHAASAKAHIGDEVLADELLGAGAGVVVPAAVVACEALGMENVTPS